MTIRPFPTLDVMIATAEEASRGDVCGENVNGITLANTCLESIGALHCVVMGFDEDPGVLGLHEEVFEWDELHGPRLFKFPSDLVIALADLSENEWHDVARQWWPRQWEDEEEHIKAELMEDPPYEGLRDEIADLVELAQDAVREQKNLYWVVPSC